MKAKPLDRRTPSRPDLPPPPLADSDRLARGLPLESGESQPRPVPRLH
jgi:hypothetical protein